MTGVFLIVMLLILGRVLHLPRQVTLLMVGILWVGMLSLQVIAPGSGVATAFGGSAAGWLVLGALVLLVIGYRRLLRRLRARATPAPIVVSTWRPPPGRDRATGRAATSSSHPSGSSNPVTPSRPASASSRRPLAVTGNPLIASSAAPTSERPASSTTMPEATTSDGGRVVSSSGSPGITASSSTMMMTSTTSPP